MTFLPCAAALSCTRHAPCALCPCPFIDPQPIQGMSGIKPDRDARGKPTDLFYQVRACLLSGGGLSWPSASGCCQQ